MSGWFQLPDRHGDLAGTWVRALTPEELDRREAVAAVLYDTDPNRSGTWPPPPQWRQPYLTASGVALRHLRDDDGEVAS